MKFICYPKCSTCAKARKYLQAKGYSFEERNIQEDNPTPEELMNWKELSGLPLKKFFNTSGLVYRSLQLKDRLPTMSDAEKYELLSSNGMLVKRPILQDGDTVLVGFNEKKWNEALQNK